MPQLDIVIFPSLSLFIFAYLFGYITFMKYILPILAFKLKTKRVLELYYLKWFEDNHTKTVYSDTYALSEVLLLERFCSILEHCLPFTKGRRVVYGFFYFSDLFYWKIRYQRKRVNKTQVY